jgi:hypothetical protein
MISSETIETAGFVAWSGAHAEADRGLYCAELGLMGPQKIIIRLPPFGHASAGPLVPL